MITSTEQLIPKGPAGYLLCTHNCRVGGLTCLCEMAQYHQNYVRLIVIYRESRTVSTCQLWTRQTVEPISFVFETYIMYAGKKRLGIMHGYDHRGSIEFGLTNKLSLATFTHHFVQNFLCKSNIFISRLFLAFWKAASTSFHTLVELNLTTLVRDCFFLHLTFLFVVCLNISLIEKLNRSTYLVLYC